MFNGLDKIEDILSKRRYLAGNQITEADVRIFGSLVRFDLVYVQHFKVGFDLKLDNSFSSKAYRNSTGNLMQSSRQDRVDCTCKCALLKYFPVQYQTHH